MNKHHRDHKNSTEQKSDNSYKIAKINLAIDPELPVGMQRPVFRMCSFLRPKHQYPLGESTFRECGRFVQRVIAASSRDMHQVSSQLFGTIPLTLNALVGISCSLVPASISPLHWTRQRPLAGLPFRLPPTLAAFPPEYALILLSLMYSCIGSRAKMTTVLNEAVSVVRFLVRIICYLRSSHLD